MKAKISPRINLHDRTPLEKVIPLSTPMTVFLDPSSVCNFRCKFCPSGNMSLIYSTKRFQGKMDFNMYKKIIRDLKEFDKPINILRLYKEGEPLLNKNFVSMVKYAKDNNVAKRIDTTTNGYLLNPTLNKELLSAGLDAIFISINGMSTEQLHKFAKVNIDFEKYVENIKDFYNMKEKLNVRCEICIKTNGELLTEEDKEKFYDTFGNYADRIFIENIINCWPNYNVEANANIKISKERGIYNQPLDGEVQVCPYIFYMATINSDGTVSLCFLDWEHKLIIGDLKRQSLKDVWNGEKLLQYRLDHLKCKRKENDVCRNCGQLTHGLPDNIDKNKRVLYDRLKGNGKN